MDSNNVECKEADASEENVFVCALEKINDAYMSFMRKLFMPYLFLSAPLFGYWWIEFPVYLYDNVRQIITFIIVYSANMLLFAALTAVVTVFRKSFRKGYWTVMNLAAVLGIIEHIVCNVHGDIIQLWDIYNFTAAVSVVGLIKPSFDSRIFFGFAAYLFNFVLFKRYYDNQYESTEAINKKMFHVVSLLGVTVYAVYTIVIANTNIISENRSQYNSATAATFGPIPYMLKSANDAKVTVPDGYDADMEKALLEKYEIPSAPAIKPDVVIIMNEAWSDLTRYLDMSKLSSDPLPVLHRLQKDSNTITGNMHTSIYGGGTANTEFEFLTGSSCAFYNPTTCIYNQYINNYMPSLASELKDMGYSATAMHNYDGNGYKRRAVYKYLGFDEEYFVDSMSEDASIVPDGIKTDESLFERVYKLTSDSDKPVFSFNVTMQNHYPYNQKYVFDKRDVIAGDYDQTVLNYLSLVHTSDRAFGELINKYKDSSKPTIVVMFGDHKPRGVLENFLNEEAVNPRDMYSTPFIIWANFPIKSEHKIETSANFLANRVLKEAGIPLSQYRRYLDEVIEPRSEYFTGAYSIIDGRNYASDFVYATDSKGEKNGIKDTKTYKEYDRMQYYYLRTKESIKKAERKFVL